MGMSRPSYGRPQSSFFGSGSMMQRPMPGGPGKGRPRGRFMRGGPGKGRGQEMPQSMLGMQQPMPARPSFGQVMTQGPMSMLRPTPRPMPRYGGGNIEGGYQQIPVTRPGGSAVSGPAVPDFGQRRTQGPMNMPPMDFLQPELPASGVEPVYRNNLPRPSGFDRGSFGQMGPPSNLQFQQVGNNRPLPSFMGSVGQAFTQGPTSMDTPLSKMRNAEYGMGFYGGGITDLY